MFRCLLIALVALSAVSAFQPEPLKPEHQVGINLLQRALGVPTEKPASKCLVCTLVVGIFEQVAIQNGTKGLNVLESVCATESWVVKNLLCPAIEDVYKDALAEADKGASPDAACRITIPECAQNQCKLFDGNWPDTLAYTPPTYNGTIVNIDPFVGDLTADLDALFELLTNKHFVKDITDHLPTSDSDGDRYSTKPTLRGSNWRGKDCDDVSDKIYPGRKSNSFGADVDHNCNGIVGTDASTGKSWEDELCGDYQPLGFGILGDSATAHFSIPQKLLNPHEWAQHALKGSFWDSFVHPLENEFDWPECGAWTGFPGNEKNCPSSGFPVSSFMSKMRERNLCAHRDFQNLGVNGARTPDLVKDHGLVLESLARNQLNDQPMLLFIAMIGNDVCNSHSDVASMTSVPDFEANVLSGLSVLETQLPKGSHIVFVPLAHGTLLFETMGSHTHPIGVKYPDVYELLNCFENSPCAGWMNSNATIRNATQAHADALSAVYPKIVSEHTYDNFDMAVAPTDWTQAIFNDYIQGYHGEPKAVIEPSDGFHPSQTGNMMLSDFMFSWLEKQHPDFLGPINPNNGKIKQLFGDQGGF